MGPPLTNSSCRSPHAQDTANHVLRRQIQLKVPRHPDLVPSPFLLLLPTALTGAPRLANPAWNFATIPSSYAKQFRPLPTMAWQPDEGTLSQLVQCLKDSLSGQNPSVQKNAEIVGCPPTPPRTRPIALTSAAL